MHHGQRYETLRGVHGAIADGPSSPGGTGRTSVPIFLIGDRIEEVRSFAYPFGDVPDDPEKRAITEERCAFSFARRAGPLLYPYPQEERHVVPRIEVTRDFDMQAFLDEMETSATGLDKRPETGGGSTPPMGASR